jgi:hypothetical protein
MKKYAFILIPALCSCHSPKTVTAAEQHVAESSATTDFRQMTAVNIDSLVIAIENPHIEIAETDDSARLRAKRTVIVGSKLEISRNRHESVAANAAHADSALTVTDTSTTTEVASNSTVQRAVNVFRLSLLIALLVASAAIIRRSWLKIRSRQ